MRPTRVLVAHSRGVVRAEICDQLAEDERKFSVRATAPGPSLIKVLRTFRPHVLVLGCNGSHQDPWWWLKHVRALEEPDALPVVVVLSKARKGSCRASRRSGADFVLEVQDVGRRVIGDYVAIAASPAQRSSEADGSRCPLALVEEESSVLVRGRKVPLRPGIYDIAAGMVRKWPAPYGPSDLPDAEILSSKQAEGRLRRRISEFRSALGPDKELVSRVGPKRYAISATWTPVS